MVCVYCGAKTHVTNSRLQKRSNQVWRRRYCPSCKNIISSQETLLYKQAWAVMAVDGQLQPFSRAKLFLCLYRSCEHRENAVDDAGAITDTVIHKLGPLATNGQVWAGSIVQVVQVVLNRFDKA